MEANLSFVTARSTIRLKSKQKGGVCERAFCASAAAGKLASATAIIASFLFMAMPWRSEARVRLATAVSPRRPFPSSCQSFRRYQGD
jgi:hypothetical protein